MEVESEIYQETDFHTRKIENGNVISKFEYSLPFGDIEDEEDSIKAKVDLDGDLIVKRIQKAAVEIEHRNSTNISLVGLQVWRGALLLADFIIHNRRYFSQKKVLEVGSGVGLTSIIAAKYCKEVICTDIDIGNILRLIDSNVDRNMHLLTARNNIKVMELNFKAEWSPELTETIKDVDIVFAADVIYDDDLTQAFMRNVEKFISLPRISTIYIAMEKRYVFTRAEMQPVAPMYETFLRCIDNILKSYGGDPKFQIRPIHTDFPQFFNYERVKELVLFKVTKPGRKSSLTTAE